MRVLQSGLAGRRAERMHGAEGAPREDEDEGKDQGPGETDDIFGDAAIRDEKRSDRASTIESGGSPYNLRKRTARKEDAHYIVSTPTRRPRKAAPASPAEPPSSSTAPRATRPAAPPLHRHATDAATQTRRDLLSAELSDQIRSILSGEGYTFASDMAASRRAGRKKTQTRQDSLRATGEGEGGPGSISPDIRLSRLDRDDPRAIEFRERIRPWCVPRRVGAATIERLCSGYTGSAMSPLRRSRGETSSNGSAGRRTASDSKAFRRTRRRTACSRTASGSSRRAADGSFRTRLRARRLGLVAGAGAGGKRRAVSG